MKTLLLILTLAFSMLALAQDISQLEKDCEASDGLACAKTAYHYRRSGDSLKAFKFYEKGCALKDETACYNKNSVNPRDLYFGKVHALMNFNKTNLTNCYTPSNRVIYSNTQLKEKWVKADFTIHINKNGQADLVKTKTELPDTFKNCSSKVIKNIQFPKPEGIDPIYEYNLTIASQE